jgi:hypothetical protein
MPPYEGQGGGPGGAVEQPKLPPYEGQGGGPGGAVEQPKLPPYEKHAPQPPNGRIGMSELEVAVLNEVNFARTRPQDYAHRLGGGPGAADAVAFLDRQAALPALAPSPLLAGVASAHAADQAARPEVSHIGSDGSNPMQRMQTAGAWSSMYAEEISVGSTTAAGVVRQLVIDSQSPTHAHRADLFSQLLASAGVGCGPSRAYRSLCVIDLTGAQTAANPPAYDCGGAFYDVSGHVVAPPPEPHSASSDKALETWIRNVRSFYGGAYSAPAGARLDGAKVKLCTDWRIKREIRADDTNAEALGRLEQSGAADSPVAPH